MAGNPLERLVHVSLQIWTSFLTVLTLYFTDFNDNGSWIYVWLEIERPTHFRIKSISCMYFSNPVERGSQLPLEENDSKYSRASGIVIT